MPIWKEDGIRFFLCDVCKAERREPLTDSHAEFRLAQVKLREEGWVLKPRRGQWEVLCPECATFDGYTLGPEGLP